jgi:peroxiredoxin
MSKLGMLNATDTLKIGDRAPDFELSAANRDERYSLNELRKLGPVVVEFLRGTW